MTTKKKGTRQKAERTERDTQQPESLAVPAQIASAMHLHEGQEVHFQSPQGQRKVMIVRIQPASCSSEAATVSSPSTTSFNADY